MILSLDKIGNIVCSILGALHEVVFPVFITFLVTRASHLILSEKVVIGVILLPLLLLPLLGLLCLLFLL